jgi:hypothetical protein
MSLREDTYVLKQALMLSTLVAIGVTITYVGLRIAMASDDRFWTNPMWLVPMAFGPMTALALAGVVGLLKRYRFRLRIRGLVRRGTPRQGVKVACASSGHHGALLGAIIGAIVCVVWAVFGVREMFAGSLLASVFLAAGAMFSAWVVRMFMRDWLRTTAWTRQFGHLSLVVDPYPGGIGGEFAGSIDLPVPFDAAMDACARLSCIRRTASNDQSDIETVVWELEGPMARSRAGPVVRLVARFRVPAGLPGSEFGNPSIEWRLEIAGLPISIPFTPVFVVEMQPASWQTAMFATRPVSA